jgi:hypothetical protein
VPEFAVKTAEVSAQKVKGFNEVMVAVGFDTAIVIVPVEFEVPAVAVHVYVVEAAVGEATRVFPIVPPFHTYPITNGL